VSDSGRNPSNVIYGATQQTGQRNTNLNTLYANLSTRRHNDTVIVKIARAVLGYFVYLGLSFWSSFPSGSLLFCLLLRRLYLGFLDHLEDFLRIKDKLTLNCNALPCLTLFTDL
jgi:hypothetical protein